MPPASAQRIPLGMLQAEVSAGERARKLSHKNERVDQLLRAGRGSTDVQTRARIYREAAGILDDEVPWLYGINAPAVQAWRPRLKGYAAHPHGGRYFAGLKRAWVAG